MSDVSKHNTTEEWESDASEHCWIYFPILWNSIGVYNELKGFKKCVGWNKSRRNGMQMVNRDW
jgi:hypothetical protein